LVRDISKGRLPAMVDASKFDVGGNLAITKGSIVLRNEVFELIQYMPQTDEVYEKPLLIVPPTINKYYILDLAPGRSLVEHLVQQGHQVFMISWRNPEKEHGHFDFDTYAGAVLEARGAVAEIATQDSVHVMAACSGGIITAATTAYLAANNRQGEIASLTLLVCAIDNEQAGTTAALTTREVAAAAVAQSARKGYLEGEALGSVFAWLRPNDLIWNYLVNNYLLGKDPPAFDILYWNQDTVRLSAGVHRDFVMLALENALTRPGAFPVLGSDVDLGDVQLDSYILAGSADHIVPWENAFRGRTPTGPRSCSVVRRDSCSRRAAIFRR
jgi:polyhydroxyalkanoate synthase subunit PhaC